MKKIKTINKLLSSLTLLSPLVGVRFNNQHQNTQNLSHHEKTNETRKMGDIYVTVEGTTITSYVNGEGTLKVDSNITQISDNSFHNCEKIYKLDLSNATSLTQIGEDSQSQPEQHYGAFEGCSNLAGNLVFPKSINLIGYEAFADCSKINSINFDNCTNLTKIDQLAFRLCNIVSSIDLRYAKNLTTIGASSFAGITNLDYVILPEKLTTIGSCAFNCSGITPLYSGETTVKKFYFLCENKPTFDVSGCSRWAVMPDNITEFISVPSEEQKNLYLSDSNFTISHPEFSLLMTINAKLPSTSNVGLILGLLFGLGIPIIVAVGFGIWYLTKKKKTTVKI